MVLGPADDGGYYLIGMKAPHIHLFEDIDWSTSRVAEQTRQRARALGLSVAELDTWYDVDDAAALRRLLPRSGVGSASRRAQLPIPPRRPRAASSSFSFTTALSCRA